MDPKAQAPDLHKYRQSWYDVYDSIIKFRAERMEALNGARVAGPDADAAAKRPTGQANVDTFSKKQLECEQRAAELRDELREKLRAINSEDPDAPEALKPIRPITLLDETFQDRLVEIAEELAQSEGVALRST